MVDFNSDAIGRVIRWQQDVVPVGANVRLGVSGFQADTEAGQRVSVVWNV